jgi:hypothetical protein
MAKEPGKSKEEKNPAQGETESAGSLVLNLDSEVPAERARALQALRQQQGAEMPEDDEWLELYGIDEDYARMVREMLGEGQSEAEKGRYTEDFDDDE